MNTDQTPLISLTHEGFNIFMYDCGPRKHLYVEDELIDSLCETGIPYRKFFKQLNLGMFENQEIIKEVLAYKFSMYYGQGYSDNINAWKFLYGDKIAEEIDNITSVLDRQYYCPDNFRVAKVSDENEMAIYRKAKKRGCCGFHDEDYQIMYQRFMIGCNYGH